jgi:hypothetical protein
VGLVCQTFPLRTARTPHRGRAHIRTFSGHDPCTQAFFGHRPHSLALPHSVAPLAEHSRSARAPRELCRRSLWSRAHFAVAVVVSIASVSSALSPAIWDALRFAPSPSSSLGPRSQELFLAQPQFYCCRPASSPCPGHHLRVPGPPLKVTILTPPLFSTVLHLLAHDCSPKCCLVHRGLPLRRPAASPPFLLSRPRHSVRRVFPNLPSHPDRHLAP